MERTREPMNKNRVLGAGNRGEWANDHEALVIRRDPAYIRRLCGEG